MKINPTELMEIFSSGNNKIPEKDIKKLIVISAEIMIHNSEVDDFYRAYGSKRIKNANFFDDPLLRKKLLHILVESNFVKPISLGYYKKTYRLSEKLSGKQRPFVSNMLRLALNPYRPY